jgi:outer membrane lipoprotein-sorting protein
MGTMRLRVAFAAMAVVVLLAVPLASGQAHAAAASSAASGTASARSANDAALVARIAAHLARAAGIRAHFTQTQTLAAMKAPLVSTGSLAFYRDRGVIWRIETPYKSTWVMTDTRVVRIDASGRRVEGGAQSARGAAEMSKMMRALLAGDLSALYAQFDVAAQGPLDHWELTLVPNQPQLAQSIRALQMAGGEYLRTLRVTLPNGDVTQLEFAGSAATTSVAPDDAALFEAP